MTCLLCLSRGKNWNGDDPKCAFENGVFNPDNWNCATMNELREIAEKVGLTRRNDLDSASFGAVPFEEGYIVMTWYKNRGTTGNAQVMWDGEPTHPLTEKVALEAIQYRRVLDGEIQG